MEQSPAFGWFKWLVASGNTSREADNHEQRFDEMLEISVRSEWWPTRQ